LLSQYSFARGCEHAYVELLPPSHVFNALRALEATLVDTIAKASGGNSSSSGSSGVASRLQALTREASTQRWPRAGTMLYLRHRAFAAAVRARYPGPEATSLRSHGRGSEGLLSAYARMVVPITLLVSFTLLLPSACCSLSLGFCPSSYIYFLSFALFK
jgi:hypothetical protein